MISFLKPFTEIRLRSAYTDLNSTSAVSSDKPQDGEYTPEREKWKYLSLSHVIDNGKMTVWSVQFTV